MVEGRPIKAEIVIIEDDDNTSEFLKMLLVNEGYTCTTYLDGDSAIESLKNGNTADLILLDLMMEGIDGYEVCRILKSDKLLRYIPIIIISGKSSIEEKIMGLKLGADDFLIKPFKNKELLAKIQVLLRIKNLQDQMIHVEKLAGLGQLASGIAHEFNNLIGGMLGYTQLALMNPSDLTMTNKALKIIESSCFRARELTENIMLFSSNKINPDATADLSSCISHSLMLASELIEKHNIEIINNADQTLEVKVEYNKLLQVVTNLLQNSIHSIADKELTSSRQIILETRKYDNQVEMLLSDTGQGIPEEYHERIFDPFFTTKGAFAGGESIGSGLGLSIVYGIVNSHNGSIELTKSSEEGTSFLIKLPVYSKKNQSPEKEREDEQNKTVHISASALIIDDEKVYRTFLSDALSNYDIKTITVSSGEEGLKLCKKNKFDIIFIDYLMKGIGGIEAAKKIREIPDQGTIIIISGQAITDHLKEDFENMDHYYCLSKPFQLNELITLVKKIMKTDQV
ncbi:MAG: response regulator [Spirochaetes bacterium]|nr:response regulator [Spirochaetota bacterium]